MVHVYSYIVHVQVTSVFILNYDINIRGHNCTITILHSYLFKVSVGKVHEEAVPEQTTSGSLVHDGGLVSPANTKSSILNEWE